MPEFPWEDYVETEIGGRTLIIDTNANLVNCEFRDPRYMDDTINEAKRAGITCCIESGLTLEGSETALALKHSNPGFVFPAVGIAGAETYKEKWRSRKELEMYAQSPSVVAIGEIGLDYSGSRFFQHRRSQKQWLRFQLKIARRRKLPVIIQTNAHKKVFALLKRYRGRKNGGVVRGENLTPELALAYVKLGYHISVGNYILHETGRGEMMRDIVCRIPLERMVIESGGYFATPGWDAMGTPKSILPQVIQKIAELKGVPKNTAKQIVAQNTIDVFNLPIVQFYREGEE